MRNIYLSRRQALLDHAERLLPGLLSVRPNPAGLHVVGFLPPGRDDLEAEEAAARKGIDVTALSRFPMEAPRDPALILGFGAVAEDQMGAAVATLADALREDS
jgi:GntR family transcriptional regulator / MocR family aminotransferase